MQPRKNVNTMWVSKDIRECYLEFFEKKGHKRMPSASLIPVNDPTLLLIGAGMAPFKPEFAGKVKPVYPRVTTCQKCVRAGDIDYVGKTSRHHTFFEMLGNFSFGDYFKEEAITWAWELVTQGYKLPVDRLWVTIHPDDDEAHCIWTKQVGVSSNRVVRLPENFWGPIGTAGPCGPCSEILFDRGAEWGCGKPSCAAGCDCDRFLEFWNLVFTMYHKNLTMDTMEELPRKNIDTGLGLERMVMILQEKPSPFETDLFALLMNQITLGRILDDAGRVTARIIADHIRAAVFMAADTITPSNEGRGYVMRQLIRRAIRHGRNIGFESLALLVSTVVAIMGDVYPELKLREEYVFRIIKEEEHNFNETLERGLIHVERALKQIPAQPKVLSGESAAELYDTYGIPLEITVEIAKEEGCSVDEEGFYQAMERRKVLAQNARFVENRKLSHSWPEEVMSPTTFIGYKKSHVKANVLDLRWRDSKESEWIQHGPAPIGSEIEVVLDRTPFYAEGGGPIGDRGILTGKKLYIEILDVQRLTSGVYIHKGYVRKGSLSIGNKVLAEVDTLFRTGIKRHHTATHLLHSALRQVLGEHVAQAGSLVAPDRLRFDFSHFAPLTPNEIRKIEYMVNQKIREGLVTKNHETSMDEAKRIGAIAFFDEKYGDLVRVVDVAGFSRELCGGIHVKSTAEIGMFKIISEEAIGQGLRRIEAKVAEALEEHIIDEGRILEGAAGVLKTSPKELVNCVKQHLERFRESERKIKELEQKLAAREAELLFTKVDEHAGIKFLSAQVEASVDALRTMVDQLKDRMKSGVVLLGTARDARVVLISGVTQDLVRRGLNASSLVKEAAGIVGGSGGGRPEMAQAGGKDCDKLPDALNYTRKWLESQVAKANT